MKSRVVLIMLLAVALVASGCSSSKTQSSAEEISDSTSSQDASVEESQDVSEVASSEDFEVPFVDVDASKIKNSPDIVHGYPLRNDAKTKAGYIADNYIVSNSQSYEDTWYREYEAIFPKFSDEIKGEGVEEIKKYFEKKASDETINMEKYFKEYGIGEQVIDSASDKENFYFQNYTINTVGNYLVVKYDMSTYYGGAHGSHNIAVDNFDLNTGKLLTLEDIFDTSSNYVEVLNEKLNAGITEKGGTEEIDIAGMPIMGDDPVEMVFEITTNGINFIFNEYVVGPFSLGTVEVELTYSELSDILAISAN